MQRKTGTRRPPVHASLPAERGGQYLVVTYVASETVSTCVHHEMRHTHRLSSEFHGRLDARDLVACRAARHAQPVDPRMINTHAQRQLRPTQRGLCASVGQRHLHVLGVQLGQHQHAAERRIPAQHETRCPHRHATGGHARCSQFHRIEHTAV